MLTNNTDSLRISGTCMSTVFRGSRIADLWLVIESVIVTAIELIQLFFGLVL